MNCFRLSLAVVLATCSTLLAQESSEPIRIESGFIESSRQVIVSARDTGTLVGFQVRAGDEIKSGQTIGNLHSEETKLQMEKAQLDLLIAKKNAADKTGVDSAQQSLNEAKATATQAELTRTIAELQSGSEVEQQAAAAKFTSAKSAYDRAKRTRERNKSSVTQSELDRLQLNYRNAEIEILKAKQDKEISSLRLQLQNSTLEQSQQAVVRYKLQLTKAKHDLSMAELITQQKELALKLATELHLRREFVAPIDGEVAETFVKEGEWVRVGDKIARLINLQKLRLEGYVSAKYQRDKLKSATATILVRQDGKIIRIPGQVVFVSPEVDRGNHQFKMHIEFDNRSVGLSPGLPAGAELTFE